MEIELRGDKVLIRGYVNAVERDSKVLRNADGPFIERAEAGVFRRALERADNVAIKLNHDRDIGSVKDGNLRLKEDAIGLHAEAEISDPETVREARAGNLKGWSFGFTDRSPCYETQEGSEVRKRTLKDIDLSEVSVLTINPAYIATTVEARSEDAKEREVRCAEGKPEVIQNDYAVENAAYRVRLMNLEE